MGIAEGALEEMKKEEKKGLGSWVRRTEEKGPGGQRRAGWDPWWEEPSDRTAKE